MDKKEHFVKDGVKIAGIFLLRKWNSILIFLILWLVITPIILAIIGTADSWLLDLF